ncbi:MAG: alpha/beta fold hydrolase [Bacillota bacterium]
MPHIEIDNHTYYYAGDFSRAGTPLVFCHGSGGRHHHWLYQLKGLKETTNPIAVDLPGHGRSEGKPADDITVYRSWLHQFIKVNKVESPVISGHSMGGAIALDYALQYPDDYLGLILVGSGGKLRVLPAFLEELKKGSVPDSLSQYLYGPAASEELLEKGRKEVKDTAASTYYADLSACDKFDIMDKLDQIKKPVLIICGSEDRLTPIKYSRYLEKKLPESLLAVIEGAGHMVMLEEPDQVNKAIIDFIKQL